MFRLIEQKEVHVAPPRAKQYTVSGAFDAPGGGGGAHM